MSIERFVRIHGWEVFRQYEAWLIDSQLEAMATVFDLGGGAVLNRSSMERLKKISLVVYLECPQSTIVARMEEAGAGAAGGDSARPPLTDLSFEEEIGRTMRERIPLYHCDADMTVNTGLLNPEETVQEILRRLPASFVLLPPLEVS